MTTGDEVTVTRWKARAAYDGTGFNGWQSQAGGNTIQDFIEKRLKTIFKKDIRIHASGRTDSGVHANGQIFHFDAAWAHPCENLCRALRSGLPAGIRVYDIEAAPPRFHARFDATGKQYIYRIYEGWAPPMELRYCWSTGGRTVDTDGMAEAAQGLLGTHDFSAYAATRADGSEVDPVKTVTRLEVSRDGPRITITAEGTGFLYKMVRSLAGALFQVGLGKLTSEDLVRILEGKVRTMEIPTAPAEGLCLEEVYYSPIENR